jgi:hypothetical protein
VICQFVNRKSTNVGWRTLSLLVAKRLKFGEFFHGRDFPRRIQPILLTI